jgi:lipoprotein NlpD
MNRFVRHGGLVLAGLMALAVGGCGSRSLNRAPVEDRNAPAKQVVIEDARTAVVKQPPGFENAGKPGYYTVKPGDTMIRIGLESGQSYKDVAKWNNLDNANKIEVGQVLRVIPPLAKESVAVAKPVSSAVVAPVTTAVAPAKAASAPASPAAAASASAPGATPVPAAAPVAAAAPQAAGADEGLGWIWPGKGTVINGFDESKNKGLDISGAAGDPVVAAAEGRVVYAGSGLRGYGNLIILKHNNTYLSAYAHNQTLLVKEDQTVKKGQKIAEMGNTDADRVKLHFEVRRQGKPVDPSKYLPAR